MFDVVIVGGGTAGLSAALMLGRSRRRVLLCDSGAPRNAPSPHAHSFFTRDGASPLELLDIGRAQLKQYDSVERKSCAVVDALRTEDGFNVVLDDGTSVAARRLLLATGVIDELPPIPGLAEMWGVSALHCPYCHGWEVRDEPLAVLGGEAAGIEQVLLIFNWSRDLVFCTNGAATLSDDDRGRLANRGIPVHEGRIARLEGTDGRLERIVFENGELLSRTALFLPPVQRQRSDLPAKLGCTLTRPLPTMEIIQVDAIGYTGVPGVYAAGDAASMMQQIALAAANGGTAGAMINRDLVMEDLAQSNTVREATTAR